LREIFCHFIFKLTYDTASYSLTDSANEFAGTKKLLAMRLIQHKEEAYWFYRFLSIFYDKYVNPLFWTEQMRDQALQLAKLDSPGLKVVDVGSGTGFTTQGIVKNIAATQVTCLDQSPHQMAKAKKKDDLQACHFHLGDAENLPFEEGSFDRYVSAGSIEYWPQPERGIREAYRVVKPGGIALLIGPLEPAGKFSRFVAKTWMLFPPDKDYRAWFEQAGFEDVQVKYVQPQWFRGRSNYGIAIAGRKPVAGKIAAQPVFFQAAIQPEKRSFLEQLRMMGRVAIGSLAGFVFIPIALAGYLGNAFRPKKDVPEAYRERLNFHQVVALLVIVLAVAGLVWWIV
ncbi:MAG: methyltransferase domain-containing protein, partial [Bacteroidota bacterium]